MNYNLTIQIGVIFLSFLIAFILVLIHLIKNPEKIESLASLYWRLVAFLNIENEKKYVSTNIQSIIANKRKDPELSEILPYGLNVKWIDEEEASAELRENQVLVMMKPYKNQSKNIANIVSLYVPKTLLPVSRKYVDEQVIRSMDYVVGKSLLKSNASALEIFIEDHKIPDEDPLKFVVKQIEDIHEVGHLSRIVIPIFQKLSVFHPQEARTSVKDECYEYIEHLHKFENDTGIDRNGVFRGETLKIAIVPIARQETLLAAGVMAHISFIKDILNEGITDVFLVASSQNISRAQQVRELVEAHYHMNVVKEYVYTGIFRSKKDKMICIHMQI